MLQKTRDSFVGTRLLDEAEYLVVSSLCRDAFYRSPCHTCGKPLQRPRARFWGGDSARMKIDINKNSEVTICDQLSQQIVFLIATGKLKPGDQLPSVRELALRCKIHSNTVSDAYKDLVQRLWIKR